MWSYQGVRTDYFNLCIWHLYLIIIAIVTALSLLAGVYSGIMETKGDWEYAGAINVFFNLIDWVIKIVLIIEVFKVRKILDTHFNTYLGKNERFSVIFTLYFGIFYLQFCLNSTVIIQWRGNNTTFLSPLSQ
jgi:hypothetical protein